MSSADAPPSSGWLEDVAVGALAGGVNTPTSVLLKVVVGLLLVPESALLAVALRKGFAVGHCIAIIILTLVLLALLVWCVWARAWAGTVNSAALAHSRLSRLPRHSPLQVPV